MRVAYQGTEGAYSEAALFAHFGNDAEAVGFESFNDVFDAVRSRKADLGFIPAENTIAGTVAENYDLLLRESVVIVAESFYRIEHSLLANKGAGLEDIKTVYSHPHALAQCKEFIEKRRLKAVPEYDTAGAATLVSSRKKKNEAAIASGLCAEKYGLDVIATGIQSNAFNSTRFFVIANEEPEGLKKEKTSIAFKTKHYAGALVNCLQRLAKNNVNLTKLESRPVPDNPWEYVFYADFEGSTDSDTVKLALSEMEATSLFIKVLGSYPKGKADK